jgi:dTDP-4-amino-4,6-dideoxygalactose transaminase
LLTDEDKLFNRALLQGHYNKRPKNEIPSTDIEAKYYLTGLGLKLRAHPLAVALASQQFDHLDEFIAQRQAHAEIITESLQQYPFLKTPQTSTENVQNSWYAYIMQYDQDAAYGVSRQEFADALLAEGLVEVDIPGSTGLVNELPLFTEPHIIMPRLYKEPLKLQGPFPNAQKFHAGIIKLPVWTFQDELSVVQAYIKGIKKVADHLVTHKSLK